MSTTALRLFAMVMAGLAGSFVAVMALSFLSGAALVCGFVATLLVSVVLAAGWWEGPVAGILGPARRLGPDEVKVLEPALRLVHRVGLAPGRLLVRAINTDGFPAVPMGRRTVIVERWLLRGLSDGRVTVAEAASVVAHASASAKVGPSSPDLAARLWSLPWTLLWLGVRWTTARCRWVPAAALAWRWRFLYGVVALGQGLSPGGDPVMGVAIAVMVAVSYLAPAADAWWRLRVNRAAYRLVADRGLGEPLSRFVHDGQGLAGLHGGLPERPVRHREISRPFTSERVLTGA